MILRVLAALLVALTAGALSLSAYSPSRAGKRQVDHVTFSRTIANALSTYGCTTHTNTQEAILHDASKVYEVQLALWQANPDALVHIIGTSGTPPGSTAYHYYGMRDVARYWLREHPEARLAIDNRVDVLSKWDYDDGTLGGVTVAVYPPRWNLFVSSGCPHGTLSHRHEAANVNDLACDWPILPICVGGTRNDYACPRGSGDCPGGGVCTNTAWPVDAALTVSAADHAAFVGEFAGGTLQDSGNNPRHWDRGSLCDGVNLTSGDEDCGAIPPGDLPSWSIGRALYLDQASVWPLAQRPVYYMAAGSISGTSPNASGAISGIMFDVRDTRFQKLFGAWCLQQAFELGIPVSQPITCRDAFAKPGWDSYYEPAQYPGDTPSCAQAATTKRWAGPARPTYGSACYSAGGPLHVPAYGPGEYETATANMALHLLCQTASGSRCSLNSETPCSPCATGADCRGGTCDAGTTPVYSDVTITHDDAPNYRGIPGDRVPLTIRSHPRYSGVRFRFLDSDDFPFSSGQDVCPVSGTMPVPILNGPYTATAGVALQLYGRCPGPADTLSLWEVVSGSCGTPVFGSECGPSTNPPCSADGKDPLAQVTGLSAGSCTLRLTCTSGAASANATTTVTVN